MIYLNNSISYFSSLGECKFLRKQCPDTYRDCLLVGWPCPQSPGNLALLGATHHPSVTLSANSSQQKKREPRLPFQVVSPNFYNSLFFKHGSQSLESTAFVAFCEEIPSCVYSKGFHLKKAGHPFGDLHSLNSHVYAPALFFSVTGFLRTDLFPRIPIKELWFAILSK